MSFEYKKKGRLLGRSSSPRDLQKRNSNKASDSLDSKLILDLLDKVYSVTVELEKLKQERATAQPATVVSSEKKYTDEEFNNELTKVIEKELHVYNLKLEAKDDKIHALELKIETLTELSTVQDENIKKHQTETLVVNGRPEIEDSIIDPTDSDVKLDSHINIKEVEEEKASMENKVGKLKELLGG